MRVGERDRIVVAGAGPAGLVISTLMARAGKSVYLLEPESRRFKVGETVPAATSRLLAKLQLPRLDPEVHRPIGGVISQWAGELRIDDSLSHPEGPGWRLDRCHFEASLDRSADEAGVSRVKARVRSARLTNDDSWQIQTTKSFELTAFWFIDATGRNSALSHRLSQNRIRAAPLIALWGLGPRASHRGTDRTLIESVPEGWWYGAYLPNRQPLVAFFTSASLAKELKPNRDRWLGLLQKTNLVTQYIDLDQFKSTSLQAAEATPSLLQIPYGEGWIACGDAALTFDPLSSQGIFNALASADLAAGALLSPSPDSALRSYHGQLAEIWSIYAHRRRAYYQAAASHFGSSFWLEQCKSTRIDDCGSRP